MEKTAVLGIYRGAPCIYDRATGKPVVVFKRSAWGWQKAIRLALDIEKELQR